MNLFLLTAAHDQPTGFAFSRKYVKRAIEKVPSSISPAWIVADDGRVPAYDDGYFLKDEGSGQVQMLDEGGEMQVQFMHLRLPVREAGLESFRSNMRALASAVLEIAQPEDVACVIEDDWFSADWLADGCKAMVANTALKLFGETKTRYYRVDNQRWHVFNANGRAALSGTMFRAVWGAGVTNAWSRRSDASIMLDDVLWRRSGVCEEHKLLLPESKYVVGIKGLPGARGLGMGAGLNESHNHDPDGAKLAEWIGADWIEYLKFFYE